MAAPFGHKVSKNTRKKISEALRNENHFNWKEKPTYGIVHYWLRQNFGKPNKCEFCKENKLCQWALIKGKDDERKRENYLRLCVRCHRRYDYGEKYKGKPECIDCGKILTFYAKRCNTHAQRKRFNTNIQKSVD